MEFRGTRHDQAVASVHAPPRGEAIEYALIASLIAVVIVTGSGGRNLN